MNGFFKIAKELWRLLTFLNFGWFVFLDLFEKGCDPVVNIDVNEVKFLSEILSKRSLSASRLANQQDSEC